MTSEERLRRWQLDMGLRLNSLAMQLPDEVLKANESTLKQLEELCLLVTEVKGYEEYEEKEQSENLMGIIRGDWQVTFEEGRSE